MSEELGREELINKIDYIMPFEAEDADGMTDNELLEYYREVRNADEFCDVSDLMALRKDCATLRSELAEAQADVANYEMDCANIEGVLKGKDKTIAELQAEVARLKEAARWIRIDESDDDTLPEDDGFYGVMFWDNNDLWPGASYYDAADGFHGVCVEYWCKLIFPPEQPHE